MDQKKRERGREEQGKMRYVREEGRNEGGKRSGWIMEMIEILSTHIRRTVISGWDEY